MDEAIKFNEAAIFNKKPTVSTAPRPQQKLWSFDLLFIGLVLLTVILFAVTIYGILQANQDLLPLKIKRLITLKIIDASSAAGLFVTAVGALLVRHQYGVSSTPRINYKSALVTKADINDPSESYKVWRVEIRNNGLGAAIINRIEYALELPKPKGNTYIGAHTVIVKELEKVNLIRNHDYWLENITTGFALPEKETCLLFEIRNEHISKIKRLDMTLYFQGRVGDKYSREIFLTPRVQSTEN